MPSFHTNQSATDRLRPPIRPRSDWAQGLQPTGPIDVEDDVKFLLVHHTASTNKYSADGVAGQIRGFYQFHTGVEKRWPDVAYNFFVDKFGGIWEARAGSLTKPVRGDATGGSQGSAILCSLIGDYRTAPVSTAQQESLVQLLAWLGEVYNIDTGVGATTSFTSRGSNRWPAGQTVNTSTIAGHRDMSQTSCPGDVVYDLIQNQLPARVSTARGLTQDLQTDPTTTEAEAEASTTGAPPTSEPSTTQDLPFSEGSATTNGTSPSSTGNQQVASGPSGPDTAEPTSSLPLFTGVAAASIAALGGLLALRTRRTRVQSADPSPNSDNET